MSHSWARVRFADGLVLHGEYNGTVDVMLPCLFATPDELKENWRKHSKSLIDYSHFGCDLRPEPVILAASYGDGYTWRGLACRTCKKFLGPFYPHGDPPFGGDAVDGLPRWYFDGSPEYLEEYLKMGWTVLDGWES